MTKKSQEGTDAATAPMETARNRKIKPGELTLFTRDRVRCDCKHIGQVAGKIEERALGREKQPEGEERQPECVTKTNTNLATSAATVGSDCRGQRGLWLVDISTMDDG